MPARLPVQFWLLILIGVFAYPAVRYVYRRAIAQSTEEPEGRSRARLALCLLYLLLLASLAVFIFTPAAAEFARSPSFMPMLMAALSAYCVYEIVQGFLKGEVMPLIRGGFGPYCRIDQARRYWASMIWNIIFACLCVFLIFKA